MIVKNISNCSHQGTGQEKDTCYHANLNKNLSLKDIENVVISINNLRKTDQELNIACHQITHILGVQAYQKHQAASLITGYKTCQEGYYHGLMSEVINSTDNYLEKLNAFCSNSYLETGNKEDWERKPMTQAEITKMRSEHRHLVARNVIEATAINGSHATLDRSSILVRGLVTVLLLRTQS
jgi:hypothetical protein